MPMIDMPLEELKNYNGTGFCPENFDVYWEDALKEMRSTDPKVEIIPRLIRLCCHYKGGINYGKLVSAYRSGRRIIIKDDNRDKLGTRLQPYQSCSRLSDKA